MGSEGAGPEETPLPIATAAAAKHRDQAAPAQRPSRLEQVPQRVVGVGVVDDGGDVVVGTRHHFEAARHA